MPNSFYRVREVATRLDLDPSTIRRYIASGQLPARRVGGQWRINAELIDRLCAGDRS